MSALEKQGYVPHPNPDVELLRQMIPGSEYGHLRGIWKQKKMEKRVAYIKSSVNVPL
jgi:hypothetical protein